MPGGLAGGARIQTGNHNSFPTLALSGKELGIHVRAGAHTGECEQVDNKCSGLSVSIGDRPHPDSQAADRAGMLMPGKKGLEKVPFRFSYRYRCANEEGCRGHEQSIVD